MADPLAVDEFAQTRGADDLFDDEIIPITGGQEIQHVTETSAEPEPQPQPQAQQQQQQQQPTDSVTQQAAPTSKRQRGHGRGAHDGGRGRGRGRGRGGRGGSEAGPKKEPVVKDNTTTEAGEAQHKEAEPTEKKDDAVTEEKKEDDAEGKTAKTENARIQAVRGDRSGTGGIKKPKLTEEELAERMAAAKLNAAKKAAAHARAEADEASFNQREAIAAEKRRQELANRKVMDSERERNRMRKLGAQTGREWDAEKKEEDYNGRRDRGSQFRRGMHGAVSGYTRRDQQQSDGPETAMDESREYRGRRGGGGGTEGGRSRGGRGRGRGGAGRGGRGDFESSAPQAAPGLSNESEFPSLPGKAASKDAAAASTENTHPAEKLSIPAIEKIASPGSPLSPAEGTWAEQVDASEAL